MFIEELNFKFYDIAFYNDKVWYACNDSAYPVRIYDLDGLPAGKIPASVIPAAYGITFDDSGYLWVSDKKSDKLYRIQIEATALTRSTWGSIKALLREQ